MKTKILYFIIFFTCFVSYSQQESQYTQYMYNTVSINPAYAGSRGVLSIFGLHRSQWVGLDGAPTTNFLSIHSPIKNTTLGAGVSFYNDEIGPIRENAISLDLSHTIQTSEDYKLSFGIKGTVNLFNLDVNRLNPENANDPLLRNINNYSFNTGVGIYLYSDKLYLGASVPNFLENNYYDDNQVSIFKERMSYYLMGGYVFDISPSIKFKPAFLTKIVNGAPLQLDLSGNCLINDKFLLGVAWRWDAAVSAMAGFQITNGILIGYGYDLETTNLANYNSGSHEFFVRFELFKKSDRIVSPRFF